MRTFAMSVVLTAAIISAGCGATRKVTQHGRSGAGDHGSNGSIHGSRSRQGRGSAVDVWLLRGSNEMAHLHSVGDEVRRPRVDCADGAADVGHVLIETDLDDGQLRIRLTPDGRDDWCFEPRLMLTFSDNTSRTYAWPQVMLDNAHPEVTLSLSSAVQNP